MCLFLGLFGVADSGVPPNRYRSATACTQTWRSCSACSSGASCVSWPAVAVAMAVAVAVAAEIAWRN